LVCEFWPDAEAELPAGAEFVPPAAEPVVVVAVAVPVATGITTLIPVVVRDTPPVEAAERTELALVSMDESAEAALLIADETTAPGEVSVIVIVAAIDD
jgi:hypothetical protein